MPADLLHLRLTDSGRVGMGPRAVILVDGSIHLQEVRAVSIVRIGLAETKKFAEGYSAIFGNKKKKNTEETSSGEEAKKKDAKKPGKKKSKK